MTRLITADELQEEADFAADYFGPKWKDKPETRRICDALVDAEAAVRAFEDAARLAAGSKAVRSGLGGFLADMRPLRQEEVPVPPDELRGKGAC